MTEVLRNRLRGNYTFTTAVTSTGAVRLLIRPYAVNDLGADDPKVARMYIFTPAEARALIECLDILPERPS